MPAYKDTQKGTWYAAFYYQDWKGIKKKKLKRGFPTKKEALAWERTFLLQQAADLTMTFEAFVEIYITDKQNRLRENTWSTKEHIIRTKILPYFKEKKDYIVSRLAEREIRVVGNPRVYKALKNQMADIYAELQRLTMAQEVTPDMLETLQMIAITLNGMKEDGE